MELINKISIVGKNILSNQGINTAFYILPLTNFNVISEEGRESSISLLSTMFSTLALQRPGVCFTIERCNKKIEKLSVYNNLLDTIRLYDKDFDMPPEFTNRIFSTNQEYALLGVNIPNRRQIDVDEDAVGKTFKELLKRTKNWVLQIDDDSLDNEELIKEEENIFNLLRTYCVRASKELVFYHYVSKLFPGYSISYDSGAFFEDENLNRVLGYLNQTIKDEYGHFVMHNEGITFFGDEEDMQQDVYGCILKVSSLPVVVDVANNGIHHKGLQVNVRTLPIDKAKLKVKRKRGAAGGELTEAFDAAEKLESVVSRENVKELKETITVANRAMDDIENGLVPCEFNASILVLGKDKQDLKRNVQATINELKNRNIVAVKSLNQAEDFIYGYLKLNPTNYNQFASIDYILSFQLTHGSMVGDYDADHSVPAIGSDI
jgi:hypothetical protein